MVSYKDKFEEMEWSNRNLKEQIEKMKNCENCKHLAENGYCSKDNPTCTNKEPLKYWELK